MTDEEHKSKTQIKKEMLALQEMGEHLASLKEEQLKFLALPDVLYQAIKEAKRLTTHGAKYRQMQYIGKVMRQIEVEPIKEKLGKLSQSQQAKTAEFHQTETWRTRLLNEGKEALTEFIAQHPQIDIQQLRTLIRHAKEELTSKKHVGAYTQLFRFIRDSADNLPFDEHETEK